MGWNASVGHIDRLVLEDAGRCIAPLHRAHWVDEKSPLPDDLAPVERHLSGDFLCAPFGASDIEGGHPHGPTANQNWHVTTLGEDALSAETDGPSGSRVSATLRLASDAPLFYQVHSISGGEGGVPVAHHPMVHMVDGGRLFMSPKRACVTPETPLEPGRHVLQYPAHSKDAGAIPAMDGTCDITHLPIGTATEDFVTLIEAPDRQVGWTAVIRKAENDVVFFLKDPRVLPVTMLWHSNGGRDFAPWNGRHIGVLGIEDGIAPGPQGHAAARRPNPVSDTGAPTALTLATDVTHRIVHVTGAIARPDGWDRVADITIEGETMTVEGPDGATRVLPFLTHLWEDH